MIGGIYTGYFVPTYAGAVGAFGAVRVVVNCSQMGEAAERMAEASAEWAPDPTRSEVVPGVRGGKGAGGIPIHSVRLRGVVAHQEVLFGTTGQSLSIRHDSYDRSSFMPGVVLAVKQVAGRPGLTIGLDELLGL